MDNLEEKKASTPAQASGEGNVFDSLTVTSVQARLLDRNMERWLEEFNRDPFAETLPPLPSVTTRDDANACLTKIAELHSAHVEDPRDAKIIASLASELEGIGYFQEALHWRLRNVDLAPQLSAPLMDLARHHNQVGNHEKTLEAMLQAERLDGQNFEVHLYLAGAYAALNNHESELASLRKAIELEPGSAKARHYLAQVLSSSGDYENAVRAWSDYLQLEPTDEKAWSKRGAVRERLGDNEGAIADYREAFRINPHNTLVSVQIFRLQEAQVDHGLWHGLKALPGVLWEALGKLRQGKSQQALD